MYELMCDEFPFDKCPPHVQLLWSYLDVCHAVFVLLLLLLLLLLSDYYY